MTEKEVETDSKVLAALQTIFSGSGIGGSGAGGISNDDIKDIENIKLIISAILNDELLESLANLQPDERDDINDAFYLNEYFDNPRIDIFIMHRLKLSRSIVHDESKFNNLLNIFADISGKGLRNFGGSDDKSIFGNRFGKH